MKQFISGFTKLTAASVLVASLVACGGADERKEKYLEKGKSYLEDKNYDKARIEFKNVLQIDPKYAEAYYFMGQLDEGNKDLGKALGNYKKAIDLNSAHINAKLKLAKIYVIAGTDAYIGMARELLAQVEKGQPGNIEAELISATIEYKTGSKSKAVTALKSVTEKAPTLVDGINLLSLIYIKEGKESEAKALLIKAVEDNPKDISLRVSLARLLSKNKDISGAEKYLTQALNIEPESFKLQAILAAFYASENQLDKAESILRKAIEQDDEDVQRYLVLVELLSSRVGLKEAEEFLTQAVKNKPDLYALRFAQVEFYNAAGSKSQAKEVLKQVITERSFEPEGISARSKLANFLFDEGDQLGAKLYVEEVLKEHPNNNDALLISSKLSLADLDPIAAINGLRTVVKNDPKNSDASYLLAQAHELNNESSLAENELKKAIEANPVNDQTHVGYAKYLASKGRIEESLAVIDKALTYFKDSYDLLNIKLSIVASQGKEAEAVAIMDMMELANANKAEININKGKYYLSKNNLSLAIAQFEKAYEKSTDKYQPLELIVKAYMANKQAEKAIDRLQVLLDKNADDAIANNLMGNILFSQKNIAEARSRFKKASDTASQWFLPYSSLAATYIAEENFDQAIKIYQDAITKLKKSSQAKMQLASIYEKQNKYTKAMDIYQDILLDEPGNQLVKNNYASLLLDFGNDSDIPKALELSKGFAKAQQPALQDTLAWAYAKSGDNAQALALLKPLVERHPTLAVFRYHLGQVLYSMDDKAAAKTHLEMAVSSEQVFAGKDKAAELLKTI